MDWLPKQCSKHKWAPKTCPSNLALIQNLIVPYIGEMQKLRPYHIEALYDTLSKTPCRQYVGGKRRNLSPKQQKRTLDLYDGSFGIAQGSRSGNEGKAPPGTAHLMKKRALIAMQYSALHNRTWITPTVQKLCSHGLQNKKARKSFDPQLPRQTFPDGDPRALNNSPPGCCLPRLRLGRAVRVPSTHKKRKTRTQFRLHDRHS